MVRGSVPGDLLTITNRGGYQTNIIAKKIVTIARKITMSKDFAMSFYNSSEWKACREAYRRKVGFICERCAAPGEVVHHKIRVSPKTIEDPEVLLSFDNLELLCRRCHEAEHYGERLAKNKSRSEDRRFTVDENGHVSAK